MPGALNVNDLIIHRNDRSGVDELSVTIHEFPPDAPASMTPALDAYTFWYRPRAEKGETWITVPELGLSHHHLPPQPCFAPLSAGIWRVSEGRWHCGEVQFLASLFQAMANEVGLSETISKRDWRHFSRSISALRR
jgi:hypothetical protein